MPQTTFSTDNMSRPAPRWWRKLEDGLLMIMIPAIVTILIGLGYGDNSKAILFINIGAVALIKFIGKMLANGEDYAPAGKGPGDFILSFATRSFFPATGEFGKWYYDESTGNYWYWDGSTFRNAGPIDRPQKPPPNP